jgi:NarL family two-component system response regulator LiaR
MEVVGEASDGYKAVLKARSLKPDVILLDLVMPQKSGLEVISEIMQERPKSRILVLTSFSEDNKVFPAIKGGALGFILKDSSPLELLQAIRDVYQGKASLHPSITRRLMRELGRPAALPSIEELLTRREKDVLLLVAQGFSNQEIAGQLVISDRTVRNHVSSILSKLRLTNRTQAALYAFQEGLVELIDRQVRPNYQ